MAALDSQTASNVYWISGNCKILLILSTTSNGETAWRKK